MIHDILVEEEDVWEAVEHGDVHLPVQGVAGHHLVPVPGREAGTAGQQEAPGAPGHGGAAGGGQEGGKEQQVGGGGRRLEPPPPVLLLRGALLQRQVGAVHLRHQRRVCVRAGGQRSHETGLFSLPCNSNHSINLI